MVESDLEKRVRERGTDIEKRLTALEGQAALVRFIGGALAVAVIGLIVNAVGHSVF